MSRVEHNLKKAQARNKLIGMVVELSRLDIKNFEHLELDKLNEIVEALDNCKRVIDKYKK
jgi:hypothetical protein